MNIYNIYKFKRDNREMIAILSHFYGQIDL